MMLNPDDADIQPLARVPGKDCSLVFTAGLVATNNFTFLSGNFSATGDGPNLRQMDGELCGS